MLRTLLNQFKKLSRSIQLLLVAAILATPAVAMAFGPNRPTFDYNKFDSSKPCTDPANDHGRCGSTTGPVFNSFINAPGYGDERNFVRISEAATGDNDPIDNDYAEQQTAQAGHEYWVRIYVHNNANEGLNCDPSHRTLNNNTECTQLDPGSPGIATGTNVRLAFNTGRANGHDISAYVKANNADEVWDEAQLKNDTNQFRMEYVNGSAKVLTSKQNTTLQPFSDAIASASGAPIGQDFGGTANTSGSFPGCFDFNARIYVKVVVKAPVIKVTKQAYVSGTQNVIDGKTVSPDTQITYKVRYFNVGNDVANDLTIRDTLPKGVAFTGGTLKWYTNNQNGVVQDSHNEGIFFNQGGLNLGNYQPLTEQEKASDVDDGMLTFRTTVKDDKSVCELKNTVIASVPGGPEVPATSIVYIDRNGSQPGNGCNEQPATPTTPTTLPDTGPGEVVGIFVATTLFAGLAHRYVLGRRYN